MNHYPIPARTVTCDCQRSQTTSPFYDHPNEELNVL
jgi:hypothetical protein